MKILNIFNHYLERGGEGIAVDSICASLAKFNEVERCDFWSADWLTPGAPSKWSQALRMFCNPDAVARLRESQTRSESDIWLVHNIFPVASGAVYKESERLGVPIIQYIHNFRPFSVSGYLWARNRIAAGGLSKNYWQEISAGAWQDSRAKTAWLALILMIGHTSGWWRKVGGWIAISDFMREKFISAGIPSDRISTLRHYWTASATRNSSSQQNHFLFLGRLTEAKGVNVLLDAWERIEKEFGAAGPRLVIGGDGPLREYVVTRAERMQSVTFRGNLTGDEKQRALDQAIALVVPSIWWEPLGLVVYEAYDRSRPVLVARSGGLSELVVEHETGLIHDPGNVGELMDQVMNFHAQPVRAAEMGRTGREWLEKNANESQWQRDFAMIANRVLSA